MGGSGAPCREGHAVLVVPVVPVVKGTSSRRAPHDSGGAAAGRPRLWQPRPLVQRNGGPCHISHW